MTDDRARKRKQRLTLPVWCGQRRTDLVIRKSGARLAGARLLTALERCNGLLEATVKAQETVCESTG